MVALVLKSSKLQNQFNQYAAYFNTKITYAVALAVVTFLLTCMNLAHFFKGLRSGGSSTAVNARPAAKGNVIVYDNLNKNQLSALVDFEGDLMEFLDKSQEEKCAIFTESLIKNEWVITDLQDLDYHLEALDAATFFKKRYDGMNEEDRKNAGKFKEIFQDLDNKAKNNRKVEDLVSRALSNLRIYEKCFLEQQIVNHDCLDTESRLFPWMTFESPIFERWDGTVMKEWPNLMNYYKGDSKSHYHEIKDNGCFANVLKNSFKGKGIALSIGDQLKDEAINLITVLRYLGNDLPIQFVHKGDLDYRVKKDLIEIARNDIHLADNIKLTGNKQEVWFVDTKRCFRESDYGRFNKFSNKWLAVLFNSFEDMILMDTDAVPFIKPSEFLKLGQYPKLGAYFFKDREAEERLTPGFDKLLKKLFPQDLEHLVYHIDKVPDSIFEGNYFKRQQFHFMESGVVVLNKRKHLSGILAATQLQFWRPVSKYTYGDKELFWLGQLVAGDSNFEFNKNPAAAIGELRKNDYPIADVIVGVQPAHIASDDHTLLWVNSGLEVCKRHTWERDFGLPVYKDRFKSVDDLKYYYTDPINLRSVIIPPVYTQPLTNDIGEPSMGWMQRKEFGCDEYYWGASSRIGPQSDDPNTIGIVINYSENEIHHHNKLARAWVKPKKFRASDFLENN